MVQSKDNKLLSTNLAKFDNSWYRPGRTFLVRSIWYFVNCIFFISPLNPISSIKVVLLRLFGAKIGKGVVVKPRVNIKYPWFLDVGNHVWIGEDVWIDNLARVKIEDNVCISQGAMLLTGNHNYSKETFDLMVGEIKIEIGAWIGARAVICSGVTIASHSVITVNTVVTKNTEPYTIYQGIPAKAIKIRIVK